MTKYSILSLKKKKDYLFIHERHKKTVLMLKNLNIRNKEYGATQVAQQFNATFSSGCDPRDPGLSPTLGSLHGACFSLCLCLCLSLSLSVCVSHE